MEASYCLCGQPYDPNVFMIQCDACKDWFHSTCCNFQEYLAVEIDKYHCPRCAPTFGPSIRKPICNWHRHDFWDEGAANKPVQTGTLVFIRELCSRHFVPETDIVVHMRGQQLTESLLKAHGFSNPIVIDSKEGLDIVLPPDTFSHYDVESYVGRDKEIDVIDVGRQTSAKMKMNDFIEYYNSLNRSRIFNVVSLEFSNTSLGCLVEAPLIVRKLDWVNNVWPPDCPGRPQVSKYCLMSVKDSYTDFHIDFGGTSVWYHVLHGEKIFYFVKPTPANLTLYTQWMTSTNQSETFFGDQVDQCFKCTIRQGQTMIIPTGWIHAVYTPVDSLVFGGNFLNHLNIPMQLSVYEIEKKIKTAKKYLYPNFEMINWFAATYLLEQLTEINMLGSRCPEYLLAGMKALLQTLKQWNSEKDYNTSVREQIPISLNIPKLLKDMGKEIRHAERYINHLNPPKPERESKRKRKKPVNKDFVDYPLSPKSTQEFAPIVEMPPPVKYPKQVQSPLKLTLPKPLLYPYDQMNLTSGQANISQEGWPGNDVIRPQETVAIHRGGTVLKFKIGAKDILPQINENHILSQHIPQNKYDLCNLDSQDIYDFHDDSDRDEDCLNIALDESPQKKQKKSGIKTCLPVKKQRHRSRDGPEPTSGIESLIHASALSVPPPGGGTSPSTEEAIAGMLSISQNWPMAKPLNRKYTHSLTEENINNVHQDEEYVYPSLDNSDDEDVHIFKPRGRSKVDEAWNPKARVGPLLPKTNRPAREGTKKQSVEKVLEAAAAKRLHHPPEKSPKRQYKRKVVKQPKAEVKSSTGPATSTTPPASGAAGSTTPKPRKGMKTAKQRLGKILKIHKMIH
ncbi:unnamed protein product [Acanthoscelides obtectus]|uniref:Uncharacterized protein n=2 Tax=Acanthoscelides obtectus TaxID=200917 RepID=A0A9P0JIZ5_ACAOB|nr:unnamed protein product [Acanthoscelides obtectus]CAK1628854.1 Lysine-specific demethylase 7B [Acanthoscelides obtectus]